MFATENYKVLDIQSQRTVREAMTSQIDSRGATRALTLLPLEMRANRGNGSRAAAKSRQKLDIP